MGQNFLFNQGFGDVTFQGDAGKTFRTERVTDLGLNWDMTRYRTYDPAIGRFMQVDPLADSLTQWTPYNYGYNNPARYNDPNGDCPTCLIGALVGAGTEYVAQVAGNVIKDGGFSTEAFTEVDIYDIGVAAAVGAATQGVSAFTKGAITVAGEVTKASIDIENTQEGIDIQTVGIDKSITEATVDLGAGLISAPVKGSITSEAVGVTQKAIGESVEMGLQTLLQVPKEPIKTALEEN